MHGLALLTVSLDLLTAYLMDRTKKNSCNCENVVEDVRKFHSQNLQRQIWYVYVVPAW